MICSHYRPKSVARCFFFLSFFVFFFCKVERVTAEVPTTTSKDNHVLRRAATTLLPPSSPSTCVAQNYDTEILIAAKANFCTSVDLTSVHKSLNKAIYQIFPIIPGLAKADMTTCNDQTPIATSIDTVGKQQEDQEKGASNRFLTWANNTNGEGGRGTVYNQCSLCGDDDGDRRRHRRRLLPSCRQGWTTIYTSETNGWDNTWFGINNNNNNKPNPAHLGPFTSGDVFYKTIQLPKHITYIKVDFTLFQNNLDKNWDKNDVIEVGINNGQSPIQLRYIQNEDTRFRKNGILSAAEKYIKDDEGKYRYTKVVLHIDLSVLDTVDIENEDDNEEHQEDENELLLRFKMMTLDDDDGGNEEEEEEIGMIKKTASIGQMKIKGTNACAVSSSLSGQNYDEAGRTTTMSFEHKTEWVLSNKLTAMVNAMSDVDDSHCLYGKDPLVHVNLFKLDKKEDSALLCAGA